MCVPDNLDEMLETAGNLVCALEKGDVDQALKSFTDDCRIEFLDRKNNGREGVKNWLNWIHSRITNVVFNERMNVVDDNFLVEEFTLSGTSKEGFPVKSKQTAIMEYKYDQIVGLRLYFNPLDFRKEYHNSDEAERRNVSKKETTHSHVH